MFNSFLRRGGDAYTQQYLKNPAHAPICRTAQIERAMTFSFQPTVSVLMTTYNSDLDYLERAIRSVCRQSYPLWQLCIVDDATSNREIHAFLELWRKREPRISLRFRRENGHMSRASNDALTLVEGEYVALLDHDDELHESAFFYVVQALQARRDAKLVYSDEDKIDGFGYRYMPSLKPRWSPELARSQNYVCHLSVYRTDRLNAIGGFRIGYEGSQDHDLLLRYVRGLPEHQIVHVPHVLYHWRATQTSTAGEGPANKPYALINGRRAVADDLAAESGTRAHVEIERGWYRVVRAPSPRQGNQAQVVLHGAATLEQARQAAQRMRKQTEGVQYAIHLVPDIGPVEVDGSAPNVEDDLADYDVPAGLRVARYLNELSRVSRGQTLVSCADSVSVQSKDWLAQLCGYCELPEVGLASLKLVSQDGYITQAGWHIDFTGKAHLVGAGVSSNSYREFGRFKMAYNCDALDRALMAVSAKTLLRAGGLPETSNALVADLSLSVQLRALARRHVLDATLTMLDARPTLDGTGDATTSFEKDSSILQIWQQMQDGQSYRYENFFTKTL